jgi:hypothetical protein
MAWAASLAISGPSHGRSHCALERLVPNQTNDAKGPESKEAERRIPMPRRDMPPAYTANDNPTKTVN